MYIILIVKPSQSGRSRPGKEDTIKIDLGEIGSEVRDSFLRSRDRASGGLL